MLLHTLHFKLYSYLFADWCFVLVCFCNCICVLKHAFQILHWEKSGTLWYVSIIIFYVISDNGYIDHIWKLLCLTNQHLVHLILRHHSGANYINVCLFSQSDHLYHHFTHIIVKLLNIIFKLFDFTFKYVYYNVIVWFFVLICTLFFPPTLSVLDIQLACLGVSFSTHRISADSFSKYVVIISLST